MRKQREGRLFAVAIAVTSLMAGCGVGGSDDAAPEAATTTTEAKPTTTAKDEPATTTTTEEGRGDPIDEPTPPTTDFTRVTDPVNGAFDVDVPVGWDNLLYSTVDGTVHHEVVSSVSPDGGTVLFVGDPKIPSYWNPDTADEITSNFADWLESMDLAYYDAAPSYFETYVRDKFGDLEGFEITSIEQNATTEQSLASQFAAAGLQAQNIDAADVRFRFVDGNGTPTSAIVIGTTINSGQFWSADVVGLASNAEVDDYLPMLSTITKSKQTRQDFTAKQNQRHQETMAMIQRRTEEMTAGHNARMQWIQDSANAHQQRMQSIWAANDASVAGFYDRMESGDVQQRQFLNYINEENTVQSSGGQKFQVDSSYQRYWLDPSTGKYAGGDINFGESQLRELGLNPSDYEEVPIVKG